MVEVAIALGIIGFVVVPLLAMLVSGFQTIQRSNSEMRSAIIAQKMIAGAQMLPFSQLADATNNLDFEGATVSAQDAVFEARLQVMRNPAGDAVSSTNLARVSVSITGKAMNNETKVYSGVIANIGH